MRARRVGAKYEVRGTRGKRYEVGGQRLENKPGAQHPGVWGCPPVIHSPGRVGGQNGIRMTQGEVEDEH